MLDYIPDRAQVSHPGTSHERAKFKQQDTFIKLDILDDIILESFQSCDKVITSSHLLLWLQSQ